MNLMQIAQSRQRFWPAELFRDGSVGLFTCSDAALLRTDAAGTTPVTASGDYIGKHLDLTANGYHFTQGTYTACFQFFGNYYKLDLTDDVMSTTLPAIASGTVVVMTSKGTWFDNFSCAAGAFTWGPSSYTGGPDRLFTALREGANDYRELGRIVINRTLTANEKSQVIAWAKARSGKGEITTTSEISPNAGNPFTATSSWSMGYGEAALSISSNNLIATDSVGNLMRAVCPLGNLTAGAYIGRVNASFSMAGTVRVAPANNGAPGGAFYDSTNNTSFNKSFVFSVGVSSTGYCVLGNGGSLTGIKFTASEFSVRRIIFP